MATTRTPRPVAACAFCAGPMPPPAGTGRPAVFCSGACRKAAHEARRTAQPGAFEVKVVDPVTLETVPRGEAGEFWTKGYSMMLGY